MCYDIENVDEKSRMRNVSERTARESGAESGSAGIIPKTVSEWL